VSVRAGGPERILWLALIAAFPMLMVSLGLARLKPTVEIWESALVIRRVWTDERVIRFEEIDSIHYDVNLLSLPFFTRLYATITIRKKDGSRAVLPSGLV